MLPNSRIICEQAIDDHVLEMVVPPFRLSKDALLPEPEAFWHSPASTVSFGAVDLYPMKVEFVE